jgi:hypothetical protein
MCDGIVIDAHMMRVIRDELVQDSGCLYSLICWITENCGIAITPQIEAHWKTKCSDKNPFFWDWYTKQLLNKSIRYITPKTLNQHVLKKIRDKYGLPKDPFVIGYMECACATSEPRYILAEEMDFHDPKAKSLPTKTQLKIRESRSGRLCRYLEKQLGIRVGTPTDAESHFAIGQGPCANRATVSQTHCPKVSIS